MASMRDEMGYYYENNKEDQTMSVCMACTVTTTDEGLR
jgi:hypothetical protein